MLIWVLFAFGSAVFAGLTAFPQRETELEGHGRLGPDRRRDTVVIALKRLEALPGGVFGFIFFRVYGILHFSRQEPGRL